MCERPPDQENCGEESLAAFLRLAPHPQTVRPVEHMDEHAALVAAQPPGSAFLVVRQKRVGEQGRVSSQALERFLARSGGALDRRLGLANDTCVSKVLERYTPLWEVRHAPTGEPG
jgi:hypothetical protein